MDRCWGGGGGGVWSGEEIEVGEKGREGFELVVLRYVFMVLRVGNASMK